jgi:hypothetical protein
MSGMGGAVGEATRKRRHASSIPPAGLKSCGALSHGPVVRRLRRRFKVGHVDIGKMIAGGQIKNN